MTGDLELVDGNLLIRRVVVGDLDTNCWIVATTTTGRAIIIDPGDQPERVVDAAADLNVDRVVLTHTHWDHVLAVPAIVDAIGPTVHGHPDDAPVWPDELRHLDTNGHFDAGTATTELLACGCSLAPDSATTIWDGDVIAVHHRNQLVLDDLPITVLHTPGHTPGSISLGVGEHVFTGDTLFPGGPGLTGWPHSDFATIITSINTRLFDLPDHTSVHPGHGPSTTIGRERPALEDWVARGW